MNLRTTIRPRTRTDDTPPGAHRRPPSGSRRPALLLSAAAAGALLVNVLAAGSPAAEAETQLESVSIAEQLGITEEAASDSFGADAAAPLEQLAASRAERDSAQAAAAAEQAAADQAELDRRAAEEAARKAAEEAARVAAERAAAEEAARSAEAEAAEAGPGAGTSAPVAPAGSYQEYAMGKLGGNASEFSCLENLWGKESGWNPNAQNPTSTAYGIPQFLDSTWAGTGIAKTSDGYRQIDAGLIYIENRYGTPCAAWGHSQANNWY
jgi:hypothetical protein